MVACSCSLSSPMLWIAALGSFLAFAHSSEFGFLTAFLATSALILCPVIVTRSISCHSKSLLREESKSEPEKQTISQKEDSSIEQEFVTEKEGEVSEKKVEKNAGDYVLSESIESNQTSSSEESENDWMLRENTNDHNAVLSDGSISDEESLIEIAIQESHYYNSKKQVQDQSWYAFQQKWSDCSKESHFRQQNWMDMMNDEENLIEIDIFMGNIKSSRFEIEA